MPNFFSNTLSTLISLFKNVFQGNQYYHLPVETKLLLLYWDIIVEPAILMEKVSLSLLIITIKNVQSSHNIDTITTHIYSPKLFVDGARTH